MGTNETWRESPKGTVSGKSMSASGVLAFNVVEVSELAKRIEALEKEVELLKLKIGE